MGKKRDVVSVGISLRARSRLKILSAVAGMTLIDYVDSLVLKHKA